MKENYRELNGDLINLAKAGEFDVIAHGCNCFGRMKRGIAPQMAQAFGCDEFELESSKYNGHINKLGQIDYKKVGTVYVVNAYTQYYWGTETKPFDYDAFTLCMRKIAFEFEGKHIGLPKIGSHLAGGDWERIKKIIQKELEPCFVTVVNYKP